MNTEIEDVLRDELHAVTRNVRVPEDLFGDALGRYRRRRALIATAAATATMAAVGLIGFTVVGAPSTGPGATSPGSGADQPRVMTISQIRPKILHALDQWDAIAVDTTTVREPTGKDVDKARKAKGGPAPTGSPSVEVHKSWFDPRTGYITSYTYDNGVLTSVYRYPQQKAGTFIEVNYITHTYFQEYEHALKADPSPTDRPGGPDLARVEGIRAALRTPGIKIVGHGEVHGIETTHLRYQISKFQRTVTGDLWFDSKTYVPVQATVDSHLGGVTTITFLPRTRENLAKTRLTIPPGYHESPSPQQ